MVTLYSIKMYCQKIQYRQGDGASPCPPLGVLVLLTASEEVYHGDDALPPLLGDANLSDDTASYVLIVFNRFVPESESSPER